ncbi:MAG: hypothetical protein MUE65_01350 [Methanomassiliicoccales archaeon]|jgi:tetratricopeptide (TPR) repeat protein|nr:hypothetical protein [Methanomassiliicoccales archaeon]
MPGALTVAERILLHISQYQRLKDSFDVPFDISQDGIAQALMISRAHVAVELKKLKESGEVVERLSHIKKGRNKRKVYFLTDVGEQKASRIREFASREGIDVGPGLDLRRARGGELYRSLSEQNRKVLEMAVVFRKPFPRDALPETSIALLPVDREGMVELPRELRTEVMALAPKDIARQAQSQAADFWLNRGDYRERLYHLLAAGRTREAEILIAGKGPVLLTEADEDLLSIISRVESPTERYAAKVRWVQAECARIVGERDYCFEICEEMMASSDMRERFEGLLVKGKGLRDMNCLNEALASFEQADRMGLHVQGSCVECEMADTLLAKGDADAALSVLLAMIRRGQMTDPENIERAYLIMGIAYLRKGVHEEALRYLSKSLAMTKEKDRAPWYRGLAEAYAMAGMEGKAKEYLAKAEPPKRWGSG